MKNKILLMMTAMTMACLMSIVSPSGAATLSLAVEGTEVSKEATEEKTEEKAEDQPTEEELVQTPEQQAAKEAEDAKKALQNDPSHEHHFRWIAKMNESESADGTMNYICEECGKRWFFSPCSPYVAFQGATAHRIETAAEGERIEVKTSLFINFDKQVMKALSERPDVSVYVSFLDGEYKGNRVSFVIPAGEDALSLLDENGYCGFIYLGNKYGLTLEEAANVEDTSGNNASSDETTGATETTETTETAETTEKEETTNTAETTKTTEKADTTKKADTTD